MSNSRRPLESARRLRRLQSAAAAFSFLSLTDAAIADNHTRVPSRSIGKVWIGARRDTIQKILGKPAQTHPRKSKTVEDVWLLTSPSAKEKVSENLKVLYSKNRVIQIETTAPKFSVRGLSLRSDPYQIRKRFGPMRVRIYNSVFNGRQSFRYYYDSAPQGIAFSVRVHGAKEVATRFQSVIIHRKGQIVLPEPEETLLSEIEDKAKKHS